MELIEMQLSEFTRRSRSLALTHAETGLSRGLEFGERILLRSSDEYRTAVVADIEFTEDETHYRLVLGGRVPADLAEARLVGEINVVPGASSEGDPGAEPGPESGAESGAATAGRLSVHDVADLLARSGAAHRIPMQRQVARRLLDR